jgi:hypothetical protein
MSDRAPCVRCGMLLHTGEGRVIVSFQADELADLAVSAADKRVRERLLCALGILDEDAEDATRGALAEAGVQ